MNPADPEVRGVALAVALVAAAAGFFQALYQPPGALALAVLGPECSMAGYPVRVYPGEVIELCIYVAGYRGAGGSFRVYYNASPAGSWQPGGGGVLLAEVDLEPGGEAYVRVNVTVPGLPEGRAVLAFELWRLEGGEWGFTGRWVAVEVEVERPPLPGG